MSTKMIDKDQEYYLTTLLEDVKNLIETYPDNSKLRRQLVNLLNRQNTKGEQPFKINNRL